jgi:hypothetical protein
MLSFFFHSREKQTQLVGLLKGLWLLISQEALPNGARKNGFDSEATKELELFF